MSKQLLIQVNAAPGTPAARQALAYARQCVAHAGEQEGDKVAAVFFYFDGVEHAHEATGRDWAELQIPLLFCQSAWQRRFDSQHAPSFRRSSLTDLVLWLERVDQVLSFGEGAACGE